MALLNSTTTYLYVDLTLTQHFVQGSELTDKGDWSAVGFYNIGDVVWYSDCLYYALAINSNAPPTAIVDSNWSALVIVEEASGTGGGGAGVDQTARDLALTALYTAWNGTYIGTLAYNLALSGAGGAGAYALAMIGTNTGTAALQIGSSAYDYAGSAYNYAGDAYYLGSIAYNLAQLGTVIPPLSTLPDVDVATAISGQILTYINGTWVNADAPAAASAGLYTLFLEDTPSGTAGYDNLLTQPSGNPREVDTATIASVDVLAPIASYISGTIDRLALDAGVWELNTYGTVSNAARPASVVIDVYTRAVTGAETFRFSGTCGPFSSTTVGLQSTILTQPSFGVAPSDKIVVKYSALRTAVPAAVTVGISHSGTANNSHIHTPLSLPHNDLGGIQGGAPDEYFHTTALQNAALVGTAGVPSGSNRYVTEESLTTEQGTRSQEDQTLQNQITDIEARIGFIGFSGTFDLYMAQVRNGLPDTRLRVVDGNVVGRSESYFILDDFETYATGAVTASTLVGGSSWGGNGVIFTDTQIGVKAEEWMDYTAGTIYNTGTLTGGTGWSGTTTIFTPYANIAGTETFETYTTGTVYGGSYSGTLDGGWYWAGTTVIYTY